jgi:hypothetical protein
MIAAAGCKKLFSRFGSSPAALVIEGAGQKRPSGEGQSGDQLALTGSGGSYKRTP